MNVLAEKCAVLFNSYLCRSSLTATNFSRQLLCDLHKTVVSLMCYAHYVTEQKQLNIFLRLNQIIFYKICKLLCIILKTKKMKEVL